MSLVDTLVLGTLAIGLILGLLRGFLSQVAGLLGLVGGLFLAAQYHTPLRQRILDPHLNSSHNGEIAFVLIVVVTVLFAATCAWVVRKAVDRLELGTYDRLMGAVLGVLKAGLICGGILLALVTFAPNGGFVEDAIGRSRAGPLLWKSMTSAAHYLPGRLRGRVEGFLQEHPLPEPDHQNATRPE